jgi:membrane protease YdiL (CAAX protease family)
VRGTVFGSAYLVGAVLLGSLFAWFASGWLPYEYEKVLSRSVLLFAGIGLVPLWRLLGLSRMRIGLADFSARACIHSFAIGLISIAPIVLFFWVVGFRMLVPDAQFAEINLLTTAVVIFVSASLVALFEETLFRGVLFAALASRAGVAVSIVTSSLIYAAVHFLAVDAADISSSWYAGFVYLAASTEGLAAPELYWDSFLSLFLLGVFLCLIRRQLDLWWCIGLHAGWVCVIRMQSAITDRDPINPFLFAIGDYDNFTGHLVSVWLVFLMLLLHLGNRHRDNLRTGH